MFDAISSHGGVVNRMIGDGLMALFGAPLHKWPTRVDNAVEGTLSATWLFGRIWPS